MGFTFRRIHEGTRLPAPRWRRRRTARIALAALLLLAAPFAGASGRARTTPVVAVNADLSSGHVLTAAEVTTVDLPPGATPDGALLTAAEAIGTRLSGPVRRGEALTDARVTGRPGDPNRDPARRVVPVPLADPAVAGLLHPGDVVDLVAPVDVATPTPTNPGTPATPADPARPPGPDVITPVTRDAEVVEVPPGKPGGARTVLVAVGEADATRLAATAVGTPLAVLVHG